MRIIFFCQSTCRTFKNDSFLDVETSKPVSEMACYCASMDGVGSMLVWVVWVACWRGKSGIVGVGGMGDVLACVAG